MQIIIRNTERNRRQKFTLTVMFGQTQKKGWRITRMREGSALFDDGRGCGWFSARLTEG